MQVPKGAIAVLGASPARRGTALLVQVALGLLLIGVAVTLPEPALAVQIGLAAAGAFLLWRSRTIHAATANQLILSHDGLFETSGRRLFAMDNVATVERGAFAFKPSNGFAVTLKHPEARAWVPGLWWRMGRRVGVGGMISGKAARDMADVIALLLTAEGAALIDQATSGTPD